MKQPPTAKMLAELAAIGTRVEHREAAQRKDYDRRIELFLRLDAEGIPRKVIAAAARTSESAVSVALFKARRSLAS